MSMWELPNGRDDAANFVNIDWAANDNDLFSIRNAEASNDFLAADPREVRRAETAPMVLTIMAVDGSLCVGGIEEEVAPDEEYRYTEEYHRLYYSKTPRDPRMLPPLTRRRLPKSTASNVSPIANTSGAIGDGIGVTKNPGSNAPVEEGNQSFAGGSSLIAEYIEASRPEWDYEKIKGHVVEFSRDQDGSRLVQRLIEKPKNLIAIAGEVLANFEELTTDVFGNYVVQKLFDVVPRAEHQQPADPAIIKARLLDKLTEQIRGKLKKYSFQTYSCRAMQKALENLRDADCEEIIHELEDCVVESVLDQSASHVVQKIIEICPSRCQFLVDAFLPHLSKLACHAYGCRVLQRTFEKCHSVAGVNIRPLLEAVIDRISEFTIHQYGNYVVQHGMLNAPEDLRHRIVMQLMPQMYALSCSKFASNVAEKVVVTANNEERDILIMQLTKSLGENQGGNYLVHMMQDTYANYVVQRFLEVSSPAQRVSIGEIVMPHVEMISQSVYGRHMLRRIEFMGILPGEFLRKRDIDVNAPEYGGVSGGNNTNHASGAGGNGNARRCPRRGNNNINNNSNSSKRRVSNQHAAASLGSLSNLGSSNSVIPAAQLPATYSPHPLVAMQGYMPMPGYAPYAPGPLYASPQPQTASFIPNASAQQSLGYPTTMYTAAGGSSSQPSFFVNGGYAAPTLQAPSHPQAQFIGINSASSTILQPNGGPSPSVGSSSLNYYPKPVYIDGSNVTNSDQGVLSNNIVDHCIRNKGYMNKIDSDRNIIHQLGGSGSRKGK